MLNVLWAMAILPFSITRLAKVIFPSYIQSLTPAPSTYWRGRCQVLGTEKWGQEQKISALEHFTALLRHDLKRFINLRISNFSKSYYREKKELSKVLKSVPHFNWFNELKFIELIVLEAAQWHLFLFYYDYYFKFSSPPSGHTFALKVSPKPVHFRGWGSIGIN